jgi:hypothetical protein
MALEEIEINKDNLNVDTFKTLIANVAEQINIKLQNEEGIPLEDIDKSVTQINNAYSMLVTVNSDTNDRDISAIEQMKVNFDNAIADIQTKLDNGDFNGEDGKDGQSFTFDMFTPEQIESLKVKGDDGQPFTYDMFTPEQLESLKVKGDDGQPFTFDMFTPEQLESLKVKGDDGKPFTYDDLTPEQKEDFFSNSKRNRLFSHDLVMLLGSISYHSVTPTDTIDISKYVNENTVFIRLAIYYIHGNSSSHGYWSFYAKQKDDELNKTHYISSHYDDYYNTDYIIIDVPFDGGKGQQFLDVVTTSSHNTSTSNRYSLYLVGRCDYV